MILSNTTGNGIHNQVGCFAQLAVIYVFPMGEKELQTRCAFVKTAQEFERNIWASVTS